MYDRYMRILLFFDLPMETSKQRRSYSLFRKNLIKEGFLQQQKSVYSKLVLNRQSADLSINRIKKHIPTEGLVQVLIVTEKQFSSILCLIGEEKHHKEIDSTARLVVL